MPENPIIEKAIDRVLAKYQPIERRCRICENYTQGQISIHYCPVFCDCAVCEQNLIT